MVTSNGVTIVGRNGISEEVQAPMRARLRMLRQSRQLNLQQIPVLGSGTMTTYETHDLAPLRLGTIFALAEFFDMSAKEFLEYLFGDDAPRATEGRFRDEIVLLMRLADSRVQALCVAAVRAIVAQDEQTRVDELATNTRKAITK